MCMSSSATDSALSSSSPWSSSPSNSSSCFLISSSSTERDPGARRPQRVRRPRPAAGEKSREWKRRASRPRGRWQRARRMRGFVVVTVHVHDAAGPRLSLSGCGAQCAAALGGLKLRRSVICLSSSSITLQSGFTCCRPRGSCSSGGDGVDLIQGSRREITQRSCASRGERASFISHNCREPFVFVVPPRFVCTYACVCALRKCVFRGYAFCKAKLLDCGAAR
jgi:hypothetical protein